MVDPSVSQGIYQHLMQYVKTLSDPHPSILLPTAYLILFKETTLVAIIVVTLDDWLCSLTLL